MSNCNFEYRDNGIFCAVCDIEIKLRQSDLNAVGGDLRRVHRQCPPPGNEVISPPAPPGILSKILRFTPAMIRHYRKGAEICTQEQIDARIEICKACPSAGWRPYNDDTPDVGLCIYCGCCGSPNQDEFLNKLGWKDESCPRGHW